MNYEFKDFRNKEPYNPPKWSEWQPERPLAYIITIFLFIVGLPYLFGYILTPLGTLLNVVFIDWWLYMKEQARYIDSDHYK